MGLPLVADRAPDSHTTVETQIVIIIDNHEEIIILVVSSAGPTPNMLVILTSRIFKMQVPAKNTHYEYDQYQKFCPILAI